MTLKEFQKECLKTATYKLHGTSGISDLTYCILAMVGEAGETANTWKKFLRGDDQDDLNKLGERRRLIIGEVFGTLWYAMAILDELGVDIDKEAEIYLKKLEDRSSRGVIKGTGEDR